MVGLIKPDGSPMRAPPDKKKLTERLASPTVDGVRKAWAKAVAGGLTPDRLAAMLKAADQGNGADYLRLAQEMEERDPHYAAVIGTRKRAVSGIPPTVAAATDEKKHIDHADFIREILDEIDFAGLVEMLMDAIGKGVSVVEILWSTGTRWKPAAFEWIDPTFCAVDKTAGTEILLRTETFPDGEPLAPLKFIVHKPRLRMGQPLRAGLARLACWSFLFKQSTIVDMMAFLEVFGRPVVLGKYGPGARDADVEILRTAVANLISDAAAVLPDSMRLELVEVARSSTEPFLAAAGFLDKQISKAVLGQTMTTDDGSSMAQAKVHDDVRWDILESDAAQLARTLKRQLVIPAIDLNYGPQDLYPDLAILAIEAEDLTALVNNVAKLVPLGLEVQASVMRDKLGLPDPEEGAVLLRAPGAAAPEPLADETHRHRPQLHYRGAAQDDEELERLRDEALADWRLVMGPIIDPIKGAIDGAESYGQALAALSEIYPQMDDERLVERLAREMFRSRALGDAPDER